MAALTPQIKNKKFQNWLKGALALLFTKQGLGDFVDVEIKQFQKDILASIFSKKTISAGTVCNSCTTENVLRCPTSNFCPKGRKCHIHDVGLPDKRPNRLCPNNICQDIREEIRREHMCNMPSWKNTDALRWSTDAFQIAKCYMPPEGYSAVSTLADTDFNGTLSIIINNKRFGSKMDAKLAHEARDVGRKIRHAADMTISDKNLTRYIDILIDLLSDTKNLAAYSKAQEAVDKLKQLKAQTLTLATTDITTVIDEKLKTIVSRQLENASQALTTEQKKFLDDVKGSLGTMQTVTMNNLDQIVIMKINEFRTTAEKAKREITEISAKGKRQIQEEVRKGQALGDVAETASKQTEQFMRVDLINFYRKYHSTIPVSPIVEEHDASLSEFYVQPPLSSVEIKKFGRNQNPPTKKTLRSLQDLFIHDNGQLYKDIYITAKAGIGKTSFVKKISMLWCQAHSHMDDVEKKFKPEDIQMMKTFEFLFIVSLRDIETSLCKIDDMIRCQIINFLSRYPRYSDIFLADTLQDRKCLVVLDGLDEWRHPEGCEYSCRGEQGLPQRPARENCTIMTTTRPWKMVDLKLRSNQIDRHVEIDELDQATSKQLITNAVTLLNKRSSYEQSKNAEEFQDIVSSKMLDSVRYIPYILLQMICIWFDGESIGESKCEIYSKILELTLSRGQMKSGKRNWSSEKRHILDNTDFPRCFLSNELCKAQYDLIHNLGKIAFETLFCLEKESTLVFDERIVLDRIPEYSLTFCLELGLLSQNKDWRQIASRRRNVSFQHKSVQEYLAALYISSDTDSPDMKERLLNKCKALASVLEMSNTFVFLGGFSPSACGKTLQLLQKVVSNDERIIQYRDSLLIKDGVLTEYLRVKEAVRAFQYMQTDIVQEIKSSGQTEIPLSIEDIIIDNTVDKASYPVLQLLIDRNKDNVKSLLVRDVRCTEEFTDILKRTGIKNVCLLQKLVIIAVPPSDDLLGFLSRSVDTLKCLRLSFVEYRDNLYYSIDTQLSSDTVRTISSMVQLKALMLSNIQLSHSDVNILFKTLGSRTAMVEIELYEFSCIDHGNTCDGELLDLSQHKHLKILDLDNLPVAELRVSPSALSECLIGEDNSSVFPSWFESLKTAENLHSLLLRRMTPILLHNLSLTLPELAQLRNFGIEITDLGDMTPTLPSETNIHTVYFYQVNMTSEALKLLAESAAELSHSVRITLEWCTVNPLEEYQQVKYYVRTSPKYTVLLDGVNSRRQIQFEFETVKENKY